MSQVDESSNVHDDGIRHLEEYYNQREDGDQAGAAQDLSLAQHAEQQQQQQHEEGAFDDVQQHAADADADAVQLAEAAQAVMQGQYDEHHAEAYYPTYDAYGAAEHGMSDYPPPLAEQPTPASVLAASSSMPSATTGGIKRGRKSTTGAGGTSGGGGRGGKKAKLEMTPEAIKARKQAHIQSEQRRRHQIRAGYESLYRTIPALKDAALVDGASRGGSGPGGGGAVGGRKRDRDAMASDGPNAPPRKKRGRKSKSMREEEEAQQAQQQQQQQQQIQSGGDGSGDGFDGRQGPRSESVALQKAIDYLREQHDYRLALKNRLEALRFHAAKLPIDQQEALGILTGPRLVEVEVPATVSAKTERRGAKSASARLAGDVEEEQQPASESAMDPTITHSGLYDDTPQGHPPPIEEQGMEALQLAMQMNEMPAPPSVEQQEESMEAAPSTRGQSATVDRASGGDDVPKTTTMVRVSVNFEDEWTTGKLIEGEEAGEA